MVKDDIHSMPVDDLKEHVFIDCPCNPRIEVIGGSLLYVHNSWDGREYIEQVIDYLEAERKG